MRRRPPATYVEAATAGERSCAFVPAALPPKPPVLWSAALRRRFDDALLALGRLDALWALIAPDEQQVPAPGRYFAAAR